MATSGTVATTTLDNAKVIEHALRRVGFPVSRQTPEVIDTALDTLYLLMLALSSNGVNLWCLDRDYLGLATNQATYVLPAGTLDVLNVVYTQPSRSTGTDTVAATSVVTDLAAATSIYRVGLKFSSITASGTVTVASSDDGISYTTRYTATKTDWATGTWYWIGLDPFISARYWKVSAGAAITVTEFYLASGVYDIPVAPYNRDDYMALNNKQQAGRPVTCYFLEKKLSPQVTLWPVPNNDYDHLSLSRYRQVQDIGTLVNELEIPARWIEGIIWQLAARLVFELEGVKEERIPTVLQQAAEHLIEAGDGETDGAPIMLAPGIAGYTRG